MLQWDLTMATDWFPRLDTGGGSSEGGRELDELGGNRWDDVIGADGLSPLEWCSSGP